MNKKSEDEVKKGSPAYMSTYGDMMTLLLTFFVLLFSMSSIDAQKIRAIVASFSGGVSVLDGAEVLERDANMLSNGTYQFPTEEEEKVIDNLDDGQPQVDQRSTEIKEELEEFIESEKLEQKVEVEQLGDEIILRFEELLLFDTGKADIKPGAIPVLNKLGIKMKGYMQEGYCLRLEGHADNKPIKTSQFPSNWYLSSARAIAVASIFIDHLDFEPSKISAEGYGEYRPIASNDTVEGRAKNRRVEIKVTKNVEAINIK